MEDDERQHLDELSRTYRRRLRYLEQREALLGVSTPPEILIEAEDIRGKIDLIGQKLAPATASKVEVTETASTPTVPQLAERVVSASPNSSRVTISANTEAPVLTTASSGAVNNTNQRMPKLLTGKFWVPFCAEWFLISLISVVFAVAANGFFSAYDNYLYNAVLSGAIVGVFHWFYLRNFLSHPRLWFWVIVHAIIWIGTGSSAYVLTFISGPTVLWFFYKQDQQA